MIKGLIIQTSQIQLIVKKKYAAQFASTEDSFFNGPIIVKAILDIQNLKMKVTIQILCNKLTRAKSADFDNGMPKLLDYILSIIDLIIELGEIHDTLL